MLVIHIPEQCHEQWSAMQQQEQGRFCAQCQKTVIDFSEMSDEAMRNFLLEQKGKSICGRMRASQLARPIASQKTILDPHKYHQLNSTQQILHAIALFFILEMSACTDANDTKAPTHKNYNYSANTTKDSCSTVIVPTQQAAPKKKAQRHKRKLQEQKFIEPEWPELMVQGGVEFNFSEEVLMPIKIDSSKTVSNKTDTIPAVKAAKKSHAFRAWLRKQFS